MKYTPCLEVILKSKSQYSIFWKDKLLYMNVHRTRLLGLYSICQEIGGLSGQIRDPPIIRPREYQVEDITLLNEG